MPIFKSSPLPLYRALFSFTLLSLTSTMSAQADDSSVRAKSDKVYKAEDISKLQSLDGKTIREIKILVDDVFEDPGTNRFYKAANALKINTKESVVRRELLFKEGDTFDSFLIKESERNLRSQKFLRKIEIVPVDAGNNQVDVTVRTQDTWTLIPSISYSSGAGSNDKSIGISESNIGGFGKRAELLIADESNRRTIEGVYEDPRVAGSSLRMVIADFYRTDGNRAQFLVSDPFRTLLDKTSWSIDGDVSDTVGKLWENGDERYIYRQETHNFAGRHTWAFGNPEQSLRRYSLGYDYQETTFQQATLQDYDDVDLNPDKVSNDPTQLAANRRFSGPQVGYESLHPRFISMDYIDRFDRTDDYDIGDNFTATSTFASKELGSLYDALILNLNRSAGSKFSNTAFIRGELGFSSRFASSQMENTLLRAESKYYNVLGPLYAKNLFLGKHTLAFGYALDYGRNLDRDREFLLGADNGLRGYDARTFTGDKRLLLNLEDRVHIAEDVFKLVSFGAAAFVDVGGTTNGPFGNILGDELYGDAGIGLRFAFPRSSGGRILRMDIAVPFRDGPDGSHGYEFRLLFGGGQVFSSRLQSEIVGPENANVEVGTDK